MIAVCMSRLVVETTRVWKSLKALRYIAGSVVNSEGYSDQCAHGDGIVGERFMKRVLDSVSIASGCSN